MRRRRCSSVVRSPPGSEMRTTAARATAMPRPRPVDGLAVDEADNHGHAGTDQRRERRDDAHRAARQRVVEERQTDRRRPMPASAAPPHESADGPRR